MKISFLPAEKKQAQRARRSLYAILGGVIHTMICFVLWDVGLFVLSGKQFIILFSFFWLGHVSFFLMIRFNFNLRFSDPSLTLPMMLWSIPCVMITVYFTRELRAVLLMLVLLCLVYGSFRLTWRTFVFLTLFAIACYLVVIGLLWYQNPNAIYFKEEATVLIAFSLVAFSFSAVAAEMNSLRKYLHAKNQKLSGMLQYIETISVTDELTGVKNRRYILNVLEEQQLVAKRSSSYIFSIFMIDIDLFKDINDKYGHEIGDKVLKYFCESLQKNIRQIDYFARFGGEEFLLITPLTPLVDAKIMAERLRKITETLDFSFIVPNLKMTISIGVTEYHAPESIKNILERIDEALYTAKNKGRNQIVVI